MKTKNVNFPTEKTHTTTVKMLQILGITEPTYYKDIKYLGIELIKDEDNHSWISHEDKKKVLGLRKHIKETGRRAGFNPENVEDLVIEESNTEDIIDTIEEETPETPLITLNDSTEISNESTELTTTDSQNIATTESNEIGLYGEEEEEIYVEPKEETDGFDPNEIIRAGAKLKAREIAMPHLVTRAIADSMTEEELPEDLKQKVRLAREAANPKFTPQQVAQTLLANYRKKLTG